MSASILWGRNVPQWGLQPKNWTTRMSVKLTRCRDVPQGFRRVSRWGRRRDGWRWAQQTSCDPSVLTSLFKFYLLVPGT